MYMNIFAVCVCMQIKFAVQVSFLGEEIPFFCLRTKSPTIENYICILHCHINVNDCEIDK